jgi:hypothetical protein
MVRLTSKRKHRFARLWYAKVNLVSRKDSKFALHPPLFLRAYSPLFSTEIARTAERSVQRDARDKIFKRNRAVMIRAHNEVENQGLLLLVLGSGT